MAKNAAKTGEYTDQRHHVVIIGGGFGGLACVKSLRRSQARITLVDQRNHHLFQPLLYQVATTILGTSEIAFPLRRLFRGRDDVTTLLARVTGVDLEQQQVHFSDGDRLSFDTLVIATGARHSYFGRDEWERHAPGLKSLEDATTIRRRILSAFESAERTQDEAQRDAWLTFAVVGAGPTGVELAGIIAELAHRVLPDEFRRIDTRRTRVLLIEAGDTVLASFPERLSAYAEEALERTGVTVMKGAPVTDCRASGIVVGDEFIACRTTLWAAGVKASGAGQWLGAKTDSAGRVRVTPALQVPGHESVYVIGDTAIVHDAAGNPLPGIAPVAKQQGHYVGRAIDRRLKGKAPPAPFSYRFSGNLATIGPHAAVADFGKVQLTGALAWWFWGIAHIYFLIGTRSRLGVAISWVWAYFTGQRSARLITQGPEEDIGESSGSGD